MNPKDDLEDEKPLDPATEKLRRKMVRLLAVSIGVMMVGVMAVLGAIVYKINDSGRQDAMREAGSAPLPYENLEGRIDLPDRAEIVSASLDADRVLLQVRMPDGASSLLVYSLERNRIIARVAID